MKILLLPAFVTLFITYCVAHLRVQKVIQHFAQRREEEEEVA